MSILYETDFYEWTNVQADLLKRKKFDEIDLDDIIEEIETLGRSEKKELSNRIIVALLHKLKLNFAHDSNCERGWQISLRNSIEEIEQVLEENPSLVPIFENTLKKMYPKARRQAMDETGLPASKFPETCPYNGEDLKNK